MDRKAGFHLVPIDRQKMYIKLGMVINGGKRCDAFEGPCNCGEMHGGSSRDRSQKVLEDAPSYIREMISGVPEIKRPKLYLVKKDK